MPVRSLQDVYARLLPSSCGYPIWSPEPTAQLLSYRPEGLKLGDVGVVGNGRFDVLFNVFLPGDHKFHHDAGVPDGFTPIPLSENDIQFVPEALSAGQVITSASVTRVSNEEVPMRTADERTYAFRMSSEQGAVLVLPQGADRYDIRNPRPLFEQASHHAVSWHRFAEQKLGRVLRPDALYVVTGLHKARSWAIAGYERKPGEAENDYSARFVAGEGRWESTRDIDARVGGDAVANQAVFVRGYKIALRRGHRHPESNHVISSGHSWLGHVWKGISKTMGKGADRNGGPLDSREQAGVGIPELASVFHPSDVINQYILSREPSADVAITHDSYWGSLIDKSLLKPEELVQEELLTKAVSESYTIVLRDGVVCLESKSGSETLMCANANDCSGSVTVHGEVTGKSTEAPGTHDAVQPSQPGTLSVVSESSYRCIDDSATVVQENQSADIQSIPSKLAAAPCVSTCRPTSPSRAIKIIVISDYLCGFCYVCDKIIHDAVEACRDLPVHFDVECRPFVLFNPSILAESDKKDSKPALRNAYLFQKYGREQAEIKLKAVDELAQKAGLKLAEDSIICHTTQSHRLSTKAYHVGGQSLQYQFNSFVFEACLVKGIDISDEEFLVDAAVKNGLMTKDEAVAFLQSTEYLDCVEKMIQAAKAQGINGVPFVIIDGKWAVNGLQPVECFIQIFRKLAHLPTASSPKENRTEDLVEVH